MRLRFLALLIGLAGLTTGNIRGDDAAGLDPKKLPPAVQRPIDFVADVQPLLRTACHSCHGSEVQEAGLRLDQKHRALQGGDRGAVIVPGNSAESRLLHVVAGLDDDVGRMPPESDGAPLSREQIGVLRAWIEQGANWPEGVDGPETSLSHWAFQPIVRPTPTEVRDVAWIQNPIDRFILARLEQEKIAPSPPADRATLLRRLYFDLLGLPPSPAEVAAFLEDSRLDAYERLVDRLLASPHYGERWGRHWLDLARYADSDGYEKDQPRPHAWRYRDWVIQALNDDLPFDRFTIAQIAGDLLPDEDQWARVAAGFHRQTLHNAEGGIDPEEDRVKKTVDRTNTVAAIWLGLTMGCAQCHSHKYDPITQRDYFSLYAFFNSLEETNLPIPGEKDAYVPTVSEAVKPRETRIHMRGDFLSPGDMVTPAMPAILPRANDKRSLNRLDLARWLVADENPLTARVAVNRVWQRLFGRGLVRTVDDFGLQGERPSHPELLDWLASEFRDNGWSEKRIVRLIVTSNTYRQSSATRTDLNDLDPENILLARQNRLRVEAEIVRDLALAVSGQWDSRVGGPSVRPPQPADHARLTYADSAKWVVSQGGDAWRRGLYTFFQRTSPYPMFATFDAPDSNECCVEREKSNTPLQALTLWNDEVFFTCAQNLGRRVLMETPQGAVSEDSIQRRIEYAFLLCLGRVPDEVELATVKEAYNTQYELCRADVSAARTLIGQQPIPPGTTPEELAAWVIIGRTLMNLDEFITRE